MLASSSDGSPVPKDGSVTSAYAGIGATSASSHANSDSIPVQGARSPCATGHSRFRCCLRP
jgi:hypothetical protein